LEAAVDVDAVDSNNLLDRATAPASARASAWQARGPAFAEVRRGRTLAPPRQSL